MKHVGVNVAADPLFTAAYTGVGGGFVVLAADDPGMYSSQNEQDSHYYACAAHIPMLDPADSAEALAFTRDAFELSERFDVPLLHPLFGARLAYEDAGRGRVPKEVEPAPYESNPAKWVMMPAFAKPRRKVQLERIEALSEWAETCAYNQVVRRGDKRWRRVRRRGLPACAGGSARCVRVQTWMHMAPSREGASLVCRER